MDGEESWKGGMEFLCTNIPHILPLPSIYLFWKIGKEGGGARDCWGLAFGEDWGSVDSKGG